MKGIGDQLNHFLLQHTPVMDLCLFAFPHRPGDQVIFPQGDLKKLGVGQA